MFLKSERGWTQSKGGFDTAATKHLTEVVGSWNHHAIHHLDKTCIHGPYSSYETWFMSAYCILIYMGVSLNGGTPKTPQNDHFK